MRPFPGIRDRYRCEGRDLNASVPCDSADDANLDQTPDVAASEDKSAKPGRVIARSDRAWLVPAMALAVCAADAPELAESLIEHAKVAS